MGLKTPSRVRIPPSPLSVSSGALRRDEHELLVAALDRLLGDGAVAAHVDLVVDDALLQRRRLPRHHRARGAHRGGLDLRRERQDPELVLGVPLVELLARGVADPRMRRHEDARLRAVDAGLPPALAALDLAALLERRGLL